jgi:spore coat protein U-like protein
VRSPGPCAALRQIIGVRKRAWVASLAACCLVTAGEAAAAVACSVSSSGVSVAYFDTGSSLPARMTGSVTVNCTRSDLARDPATLYVALGAASGNTNSAISRARLVGGTTQDTMDYWLHPDATESLVWSEKGGSGSARLTTTLNVGSGATASQTIPYYARVPPASMQGRTLVKGLYQDTQTLTLYQSTTSTADAAKSNQATLTTSLAVQVTVPENCLLSSPPGNLAFTYTSFQASPAMASTSFAVTCVSNTPYTLTLDATTGTLAGLVYSLALSTASQTGTGLPQQATISGTIAAGQSGICSGTSCTDSAVRTLTVTY